MNKIKFKKKKFLLSVKNVIFITTIIGIGISFCISKKLSVKTVDYIQNVINENNNTLYSEAYNKASDNFKTDDLINVINLLVFFPIKPLVLFKNSDNPL